MLYEIGNVEGVLHPSRLIPQIWRVYETVGSKLYRGMVCTWKAIRDRGGPIPPQVDAAEWALWDAYWRRTDVQDVAWTNRQNRASQSDTAGRAVHHLGRRSTVTDYYQSVRIYVFLQSSITCR